MDWSASVDLYCERTGPGLWAEPLNAVSNAAFFLAAVIAIAHLRRRPRPPDHFLWLLIGLVALIGAGSTLFHTEATQWTAAADVVPITVFVYSFFLYSMRRFIGLPWLWAILATIAFLALSWMLIVILPEGFINGSGSYLPAFLAMSGVGFALMARGHPAGPLLATAGGLFLVSLMFRSIDRSICDVFPTGVHFVWHILNGVVLWLLLEAAIRWGGRPQAFTRSDLGS